MSLLISALLAFALIASAIYIHDNQPYTPANGVGYWIGLVGGCIMALILIYPLCKRLRLPKLFGPLRHWFRFHMIGGIAGPVLILYHSTFHVGSFNAAIALTSMLLVAGSGTIGRFLYRHIHIGLYGRQATLKELQEALASQLTELSGDLGSLPLIRQSVDGYLAYVNQPTKGTLQHICHFFGLGWQRRITARRIKNDIPKELLGRDLLLQKSRQTLAAAHQAAQFNTYVRLFSLWHAIHIPFLWMLFFTAIAHVVAVHTY